MNSHHNNLTKKINILTLITIICLPLNLLAPQVSAFPIYAQQGYENPREATGRIVCANCHLAQKNIALEVPKSVLPNTVFEATIKIPYDINSQQILGNGKTGNLNVGAVLILPNGFKMAPPNMVPAEIKEKTKNIYIQPYSTTRDNILVVGPMASNKSQEITFPILSPDPSQNKDIHFLKYPIYAGGNRGRGQVYPNGDKTNNNAIVSPANGTIDVIKLLDDGGYQINIKTLEDVIISENIPKGINIQVTEGEKVLANQMLTKDPNVGGFGQNETEIVLQSPTRIKGMIAFFTITAIAQTFFILKKKQWEKVQASEMNF